MNKYKAYELFDMIQNGEITAAEICGKAFIDKTTHYASRDIAMAQAESIDARKSENGILPSLAGIPVGITDNICIKGIPVEYSSKMLSGFIPPYDAAVVDKLTSQVIIGMIKTGEFDSESHNDAIEAILRDECIFAITSDNEGWQRSLAAYHNLVGFKPTYGSISRYGLIPVIPSLEQIGIIGRCVKDISMLYDIISSREDSLADGESSAKVDSIDGMRFGYIDGFEQNDVLENLQERGAIVLKISIPTIKDAYAAWAAISAAETASSLARYDGIKYGYRSEKSATVDEMFINTRSEGFGDDIKKRIILGTIVLDPNNDYYVRALEVRRKLCAEVKEVFKQCDCLITSSITKRYDNNTHNYALLANLAGLPAMTISVKAVERPFIKQESMLDVNLPANIQILAPKHGEGNLLKAAYKLEQLAR